MSCRQRNGLRVEEGKALEGEGDGKAIGLRYRQRAQILSHPDQGPLPHLRFQFVRGVVQHPVP